MKLQETEHVELKKSTALINEAVISIVSILNKHGGGDLYFGIDNRGEIIGQAVTDKTLRTVSQAIANHIEPKIFPVIEKKIIDKKQVIKVTFSGIDSPYFASGRAYIRVADEDRQISAAELKKMILAGEAYRSRWDFELCDLAVEAVDRETLASFIQRAEDAGRLPDADDKPLRIIEKLRLSKNNRLSLAAKYLFTSEHSLEVQAAVFAGREKLTFLDIRKYNMPLLNLLETVESYLKEKMNWRVEFVDFKRVEIPEIPIKAMREALVNSLIHRDFHNPKGNEVAIFKDRIEIFNPGAFPEGMTPEDFIYGNARSYLRNPLIAEIFYLTKDVEKWGSGLKRIHDECKASGVKVQFGVTGTGFVTIFYRSDEFTNFAETKKRVNSRQTGKDFGKTSERLRKDFGTDVARTFKLIAVEPSITAKDLAGRIHKSSRTIENHISKLKKSGIIVRRGPKLGGYWEVVDH